MMKEVFEKIESKMEKTISVLKGDFASIRAGRATAAVLDKINVDYYGVPTSYKPACGGIGSQRPEYLVIQPWDASSLKAIEKAIQTSDLGINPQNDGKVIRLVFPPLTEERRKEIVKDDQEDGRGRQSGHSLHQA